MMMVVVVFWGESGAQSDAVCVFILCNSPQQPATAHAHREHFIPQEADGMLQRHRAGAGAGEPLPALLQVQYVGHRGGVPLLHLRWVEWHTASGERLAAAAAAVAVGCGHRHHGATSMSCLHTWCSPIAACAATTRSCSRSAAAAILYDEESLHVDLHHFISAGRELREEGRSCTARTAASSPPPRHTATI